MKLAVKLPAELVVTEATIVLSNDKVAIERGSNPLPVTVIELKTGPELGLIEMVGLDELSEVEKFHSQLSSTPFESKQSKKLPFLSSMLEEIDAM